MQRKFRQTIEDIILIILFLVAVGMAIWYIFGDSPTFEQINLSLIAVVVGILFKIYREVGEIKMAIKHSFANVSKDINSIKNKMKL